MRTAILSGYVLAAMEGCFFSVRGPLLPKRVQSISLSVSSTQHMWELRAGNYYAKLMSPNKDETAAHD